MAKPHDHEADHGKAEGGHGGGGHGGGGHGGHGGGGGHEEHEGAPEWLISFADNVTLMMGFFVIMLAMNMGPKGGGSGTGAESGKTGAGGGPPPAFIDAQLAIRSAFNNPVDLFSLDPRDQVFVRRLREKHGEHSVEDDGPPGDSHKVQSLRPSDYFSPCGRIPFEQGARHMSEPARKSLDDVAQRLRGLRYIIEIRAHASEKEAVAETDHGMQLSFDRGMTVARALHEAGLEWRQLRLVACADHERVEPTVYGDSGHELNQRVEIVLKDAVMPE